MTKVLITVVLCLFCVSPVFGFDLNGTYEKIGPKWDIDKLVIDGNKFDLEIRENDPGTYCIVLKNGIIKESKGKIQVYQGDELYYEIKKKGNTIQLIPKGEIVKVCSDKKLSDDELIVPNMVRDDYYDSVRKWKWKKVK